MSKPNTSKHWSWRPPPSYSPDKITAILQRQGNSSKPRASLSYPISWCRSRWVSNHKSSRHSDLKSATWSATRSSSMRLLWSRTGIWWRRCEARWVDNRLKSLRRAIPNWRSMWKWKRRRGEAGWPLINDSIDFRPSIFLIFPIVSKIVLQQQDWKHRLSRSFSEIEQS